MIRSWKTTLGGSLNALGTTLVGVGVVPSLTSMASAEDLKWVVITGFILQGLGQFFGSLFAADTSQVKKMIDDNNETHP